MEAMDRHFWLTRSVARVAGVNLARAMAAGHLKPAQYNDMIARCQSCDRRGTCEVWLATQTDWPALPPAYCAHAPILDELRQIQRPH
ncbi:hypothetical protein E1832_21365 [Antarcticimicrobium luteum]|uniref:DUF6455 domain-containing protein n=2 Tax=Antarcticimicrobium luteum TaxID=2547397 RepID=A0A4R5UR86_9RHOB|nr:hypothetical protein E1832_21365 [Antarcticimicrobium luteum]